MQFEKLDVWKLSIEYSTNIYRLTSGFPDTERYGLISQLRRASVSISLNIAEGSGRTTNREYCRFIDIALSSALECISALHIALNLEFITEEAFTTKYQSTETIIKKLYSLKKYLNTHQRPQNFISKPSTLNSKLSTSSHA